MKRYIKMYGHDDAHFSLTLQMCVVGAGVTGPLDDSVVAMRCNSPTISTVVSVSIHLWHLDASCMTYVYNMEEVYKTLYVT